MTQTVVIISFFILLLLIIIGLARRGVRQKAKIESLTFLLNVEKELVKRRNETINLLRVKLADEVNARFRSEESKPK